VNNKNEAIQNTIQGLVGKKLVVLLHSSPSNLTHKEMFGFTHGLGRSIKKENISGTTLKQKKNIIKSTVVKIAVFTTG